MAKRERPKSRTPVGQDPYGTSRSGKARGEAIPKTKGKPGKIQDQAREKPIPYWPTQTEGESCSEPPTRWLIVTATGREFIVYAKTGKAAMVRFKTDVVGETIVGVTRDKS